MISIISEKNPIECWINTPTNYYIGNESFGNNISELQFKNMQSVRLKLHKILDKIEEDLGSEIASLIDEITIIQKDSDTMQIAIFYNNYNGVALGDT